MCNKEVYALAMHRIVKSDMLSIFAMSKNCQNHDSCWELMYYSSFQLLKELGHAILGNFSTDRMVVELTKISK